MYLTNPSLQASILAILKRSGGDRFQKALDEDDYGARNPAIPVLPAADGAEIYAQGPGEGGLGEPKVLAGVEEFSGGESGRRHGLYIGRWPGSVKGGGRRVG